MIIAEFIFIIIIIITTIIKRTSGSLTRIYYIIVLFNNFNTALFFNKLKIIIFSKIISLIQSITLLISLSLAKLCSNYFK
jgi:hypothetical protein